MKRIRRIKFREKCPCWFIGEQSGKWVRFPPEERHKPDRFDPGVGPCVLACKGFPCLRDEERGSVEEMMKRELQKIYRRSRLRKYKRVKS